MHSWLCGAGGVLHPRRLLDRIGELDQLLAVLRRRLFGIDASEVTFAKRGFPRRDPAVVARLEQVGRCFTSGYMAALDQPHPGELGRALDEVACENRGFAFEGAGMALALLDRLTPWKRDRLQSFLAGAGERHVYMVLIGAGWAWARLGTRVAPRLTDLHPVLGWMALDGFGFHEGYFHPARTVVARQIPRQLKSYARTAFDTGVGRSLWFVSGADPDELANCIARFPAARHSALWAGSGLACAYAGSVSDAAIARVAALSGVHRPALAQGAAFAAKARERAATPAPHTERAIQQICARSGESAASLCDAEFEKLPSADLAAARPRFEDWRSGIRESFEQTLASPVGVDVSAEIPA